MFGAINNKTVFAFLALYSDQRKLSENFKTYHIHEKKCL